MNATEARQRSLDNQYENAMKEIDKAVAGGWTRCSVCFSDPLYPEVAERIAERIAERNYLKAMTLLRISFLYSFFILSGRKEASIRSSHFTMERRNFLAMLLITFSLSPDAVITLMKSDFRIFRFLPFSVRASSSVSSGITILVQRRS